MTAHRAWRARNLTSGSGGYIAWSEIQQRTTIGGSDVTGITGSAIADSNYPGLIPSQAYDNNINTLWACNGTGIGSWCGWDYGAPTGNWQDIIEFLMTTRNDGSWPQNSPDIAFDWSDDWNGTTGTWTEAFRNSHSFTGAGQSIAFAAPPPIIGLDVSKIEDVAWLEPGAGLSSSKIAALPWLDPGAGLSSSKIDDIPWLDIIKGLSNPKLEPGAWLDLDGLRGAKMEVVAWIDSPDSRRRMSLM